MPFITPPTAITGAVVQAQHRNVLRVDHLWFNALVPAPAAADRVPALVSASAGAWAKLQTASFQAGAVGTTELADGSITTAKVIDESIDVPDLASDQALALVPVGLVLMVRTAAEIPAGWEREDDLDGRHIVNAGTTFSVTFIEATNYGSDWDHGHSGFSITTGAPTSTQANISRITPQQTTAASVIHTHSITGSVDDAVWVIPSHAYCFMRYEGA